MVRESEEQIAKPRLGHRTVAEAPLVEGLLWNSEWLAPSEGPLTILWKIALANCLTPRELCRLLFGRNLLANDSNGSHGRTLLNPVWMMDEKAIPTSLGILVRQHALDMTSPQWVSALASDDHIRYCKACISGGYQSAFCQIDGLLTCPVHDLPLLQNCTLCGAPTPRYALNSLAMSSPYCCHSCGAPLGSNIWSPVEQGLSPEYNAVHSRYGEIERWLLALADLNVSWRHLASWQCASDAQNDSLERRISVFSVLRQLVVLQLADASFRSPRLPVSINAHYATPTSSKVGPEIQESTNELNARRTAYKAIRRHIRRLLKKRHRRCFQGLSNVLQIEWGTQMLHPIAPVCPLIFAYFLWRHHFEEDMALDSHLGATRSSTGLRKESLEWPLDWEVGLSAWCGFAVESFFAFAQVAKEWTDRVEQCPKPYAKENSSFLRQMLTEFSVPMTPRSLAWASRVTALKVQTARQKEKEVAIVVGPSGSLHKMLAQPNCAVDLHPETICFRGLAINVRLIAPTPDQELEFTMSDDAAEPQVRIAPLERLELPPHLDGHRLSNHGSYLEVLNAKNDVEAVKLWLENYADRPATYGDYRIVIERLINWAVIERGKPMSELDETALVAFDTFLANPLPTARWLCPRGTPRSDPNWKPFSGPMSQGSRIHSEDIIRLLFKWLNSMGYHTTYRVSHVINESSMVVTSSLKVSVDRTPTEIIRIDDWRYVVLALAEGECDPHHLYARLAVELMYYGNLKVSEVTRVSTSTLVSTPYATLLRVASRSSRDSTIYMLPPIVVSLSRLGIVATEATENPFDDSRRSDSVEYSERPLYRSSSEVRNLTKEIFQRASKLAQTEGDLAASARLTSCTCQSLRYAFELHAHDFDHDKWIWRLIGSTGLVPSTLRGYLHPRKELTEQEWQCALHDLAPCLNTPLSQLH